MNVQVISFNCILKNKAGQIISKTYNREVVTAEEANEPLRGLAKGLKNLTTGERRSIEVIAEEAYGLYQPNKVVLFPRRKLPTSLQINDVIAIPTKSGITHTYKVIQFHGDMVSLDGNHPLAGQDLIFEIETIEARQATPDEIADSTNYLFKKLYH